MSRPEVKVTTREAASMLGITPRSVLNWIRRGLLRGYRDKSSRAVYVLAKDVTELLPDKRLVPMNADHDGPAQA